MSPKPGPARRTEAQFEQTLTVTGTVSLDVSIRSGRIRVRAGDDGRVIIRGSLRTRASLFRWLYPDDPIEDLAAEPPIYQKGATIQIGDAADRWLLRRVDVLLDITAPPGTRVRALGDSADLRVTGIHGPVDCETDSGEIEISNIQSQVSASTDCGSIHIRQIDGPVDVRSDSGAIRALQVSGGIDARADSGSIRLSQTKANPIYARTDSGSVRIKLAPDGGYTVKARTDCGQVEIPGVNMTRSTRETSGIIRGGGSVVVIETDSGSIEVD